MHLRRRPPAGEVDLVRVREVERRLLEVARHVDEHRPAPSAARDVEGGPHRRRDLADVGDEPRVLDDRHRDPGDVALLERVRADQARAHLARDADEGRRVHPGVRDRRDEVRRARTGCRDRDADPARRPRVALRHVPGALLVPGEDVTHGRPAGHRVVGRHDRPARDAEHHVHPLGLERAEHRVAACHLHRPDPQRELRVATGAAQEAEHGVDELPSRRRDAGPGDVGRPAGRAERGGQALLERLAGGGAAEPFGEEQRRREQHRARVGHAVPREIALRPLVPGRRGWARRREIAGRDEPADGRRASAPRRRRRRGRPPPRARRSSLPRAGGAPRGSGTCSTVDPRVTIGVAVDPSRPRLGDARPTSAARSGSGPSRTPGRASSRPAPSWRAEKVVASPVSSSTLVTRAPRSSAARSPSSAGAASPATSTASALERRLAGRRRKGVARAGQRFGVERRVQLLDGKAVLAREAGESPARGGRDLGPDPVAGQAGDDVRPAAGHSGERVVGGVRVIGVLLLSLGTPARRTSSGVSVGVCASVRRVSVDLP